MREVLEARISSVIPGVASSASETRDPAQEGRRPNGVCDAHCAGSRIAACRARYFRNDRCARCLASNVIPAQTGTQITPQLSWDSQLSHPMAHVSFGEA